MADKEGFVDYPIHGTGRKDVEGNRDDEVNRQPKHESARVEAISVVIVPVVAVEISAVHRGILRERGLSQQQ